MPEITRRRTGELLRIVFELLLNKPDGLPAKEILAFIPTKTSLSDYEAGYYSSAPGSPRYEKIVRFATVDVVKAGWLIKNKGLWILTEEGRQSFKKYPDPEKFYKEAVRLYQEWKRSRPKMGTIPQIIEEAVEDAVEKTTLTFEEAEETAWDQIKTYLQNKNPYEFQDMVADLLRAMDYHISWIAPPGKDRGVDIIAHTDPLGANNPRIKVQVKRRDQPIHVEGLRAFMSVLGSDDVGLFVSTGGFTSDARDEARSQERRKITLLDLQNFLDLWIEHYDRLTQDARQRFPLKPIYFLSPQG